MASESTAAKTPLHDLHVEHGGRMVDFSGWRLPVQYRGVIDEHRAVRGAAGLFDVSHMGEIRVFGAGARQALDALTPNDLSKLRPGRAHYSGLLTDRGTYVDDLLIYQLEDEEYLLVVNAANSEADFHWVRERIEGDVEAVDVSADYALLALQGPRAEEILASLTEVQLDAIRYYRFERGMVAGVPAIVSRTGYTGEAGFELYLPPAEAPAVWRELMRGGEPKGLVPAGLGARDTLRLEAAMALYGHEIDDETTPFEAGLDWVVKLDKGDFLGRDALVAQRDGGGPDRRLVGFEVTGRGIAREGHSVLIGDKVAGRVTSGTWSPTFEKALGMAYVPQESSETGTEIGIEVRGRRLEARIVDLPFYRRPKA